MTHQPMEVLDLAQGEPAWHEFRRDPANHPASYAAVVLGRSPFMTRTELLDAYATGLWPEPSEFQQQIFAKGHRVEALYRPRVSEFLAQEVYPVVGRRTWPSLRTGGEFRLSASMDYFWEDEQGNGECKWLNEDLRAALPHAGWAGIEKNDARNLPQFYRDQMEQQCLVMGKERVLFVACDFDDQGNLVDERLCWYESDPDLAAEIVAGWKQFDADLITHKPIPKVVKVQAEAVEALPVLWAKVEGQLVVTHNFAEWDKQLRAYIARLPKDPKTDQDFANLAQAVKVLDDAEKKLDAEEDRALASLASVNAMRTAKATLRDFSSTNRRFFNNLVETKKKLLRSEILQENQNAFDAWVREQNTALGAPLLSTAAHTIPDAKIADYMSGKKSVQGWRDGAAQAVADAKVKVTAIVLQLTTNRAAYNELVTTDPHRGLFADLNQLLFKDSESFRIIVGGRISDWNAKEEKRLAQIKADAEAAAEKKLREEEAARAKPAAPDPSAGFNYEKNAQFLDQDEPPRAAALAASTSPTRLYGGGALRSGLLRGPAPRQPEAVLHLTPETLPAPATGDGPTLTITELNARFRFTVNAALLESLGVTPVSSTGNAKRYREADLPRMCIALRNHLLGVMAQKNLAEVSA